MFVCFCFSVANAVHLSEEILSDLSQISCSREDLLALP